jgi:CheY-like chemotaxis protein
MYILVVEDDHLQAQSVISSLEREFTDCKPDSISTEYEFRSRLPDIARNPPDLIVMDVMLRWTDPAPDQTRSPEDVTDKPHRAGFRCQELMASNEKTKNIPLILYTVLEKADIQHEFQKPIGSDVYMQKGADNTPLIRKIRERLKL